ncbi:hypothetical protein H0274_06040 [Altererythrobacter sp. CC-YST694]|uniref:hypothetical protein n=1 Tax=Altererythrobacter sp. CC-YST694 TaxID=2755038 RepID=UPI001D0235B4|nr:hypothetical protein [Altererythrobacter sp. CC-YST694]MCB5424806.1 hypothetical protein [Altererythrobacter sp. CC-YST694]
MLGSTGLSAQVVPPQVDPPAAPPPEIVPPLEPATPPQPAETPAIPPATPSAAPQAATAPAPIMQSSPVVQPLPVEEEGAVTEERSGPASQAAREAAPVQQRATPRVVGEEAAPPAPVNEAATVDGPVIAPPAVDTDYFPAENTAPESEPLLEDTASAAGSPNDTGNPVISAIDGIAWGAAGTVLLLALFSGPLRRRRKPEANPPRVTRAAVERRPDPVATVPVAPVPVTAFNGDAAPVANTIAPSRIPLTVQPRFMARSRHSRGAVDLPPTSPASFAERDALLKRMMDAPPDKANPFRSRRARLKRARLIIQSIGRRFERADPWIDLSDYPEVWPELARRNLQAA